MPPRKDPDNAKFSRLLRYYVQTTYDEVAETSGHPLVAMLKHIGKWLDDYGEDDALDHSDAEISRLSAQVSRLTVENAELRKELGEWRARFGFNKVAGRR